MTMLDIVSDGEKASSKWTKSPQISFKMKYNELNLGQIEAIVNKLGGMEGVNEFLSGKTFLTRDESKLFTLTVKPSLTLAERIQAGNYDWKNANINDIKFPHDTTTIGEWEYKLIHPNQSISSENAKKMCETDGFQAAKLEHLLIFGEVFPDEQKKFLIIALGSVCELGGERRVPGLWGHSFNRDLGLGDWARGWRCGCRFLAVRQVSSGS